MTSKEHKRHADLAKPEMGYFNKNEWCLLGTKCDTLKSLADKIFIALSPNYKCAYIDAIHINETHVYSPKGIDNGIDIAYTSGIEHQQIVYRKHFNRYQHNQLFADADLVLVNGNHDQAMAQVVIIDPAKEESLQRRLLQLTNVQLFLLANGATDVFDFIKTTLKHWQQIPIYHIHETEKIISFFNAKLKEKQPQINGLVLAGGKSIRMGYDKTQINWHGKEQKYYIADMLKPLCNNVYISCRQEQIVDITPNYPSLPDSFIGLGPYGAILSAFRQHPDKAWLVVASDLPLLDSNTLMHLIANRSCKPIATTYQSTFDNLPEPLITIWEPKSYPTLLAFLAQGISCPRKVLINSDTKIIQPLDPITLTNINTAAEAEQMKQILTNDINAK